MTSMMHIHFQVQGFHLVLGVVIDEACVFRIPVTNHFGRSSVASQGDLFALTTPWTVIMLSRDDMSVWQPGGEDISY